MKSLIKPFSGALAACSFLLVMLSLSTFLFSGCQSSDKEVPIIELQDADFKEINLDGTFNVGSFCVVADTLLVVLDNKDLDAFVKFYNINSQEFIGGFGAQGRGPNEYTNPTTIRVYPEFDRMWVRESPKRRIIGFALSKILGSFDNETPPEVVIFQGETLFSWDYQQISDSTLLLDFTGGTQSLFTEINMAGQVVRELGANSQEVKIKEPDRKRYFFSSRFALADSIAVSAFMFHDRLAKVNLATGRVADWFGAGYEQPKPISVEEINMNRYRAFIGGIWHFEGRFYAPFLGGTYLNEDYTANRPNTMLIFDTQLQLQGKIVFPFGLGDTYVTPQGLLFIKPDNSEGKLLTFDLNHISNRLNTP